MTVGCRGQGGRIDDHCRFSAVAVNLAHLGAVTNNRANRCSFQFRLTVATPKRSELLLTLSPTCFLSLMQTKTCKHTHTHTRKKVHSALLTGAPQGEARRAWWDEKLEFQFEEDDEEDEKEKQPKTSMAVPKTVDMAVSTSSTAGSVSGSSRDGGSQDAAPAESLEMPDVAPATPPIPEVGGS